MKKLLFTIISIVLCFGMYAQTVTGSGNIITKNYPVTGFNELDISVAADVIFTQSDNFDVKITTDDNLFDYIAVKIKDNELTICRKAGKSATQISIGEKDFTINKHNLGKIKPTQLVIKISAPNLEDINFMSSGTFNFNNDFTGNELNMEVVSSGKITSSNSISVKKLEIELSGSGKIDLKKTKINELEIGLAGSGNVTLNGTIDNADVEVAGSGNVLLSGTFGEADIEIAGSGNAKVDGTINQAKADIAGSGSVTFGTIKSTLKYDIIGSGNVIYSGNPSISGNKIGSGSLKHQ